CRRQKAPIKLSRFCPPRESCLTPVSPETCPLVQAFLAECPGRLFLGHAQTQLKTGLQIQERHLFLFTDTLLVTKAKSPTHFKVKAQVRVCEMWTANCMEEVCEGSTNPERSFVMGWPTCNCVATFSSEETKDKWLALVNSRISEGKEKDDPKTIPLKIFAKDIGNCAYVSFPSSPVSFYCLRQHKNSYLGHEFPFSIKMSHIRDGGSNCGGLGGGVGKDVLSPTDCPGVLLLDQCLPPDTQCQFILKPNKPRHHTCLIAHAQPEKPGQQKPFKRKRSLINWPFWRGSSTQLDGVPLSPTLLSAAHGRLFGQPLSSICSPENGLPKPVMDMLAFLYLEGPYTRGIFRRSAGAKACRELRDRLDSGSEDAEITHQSVFVIAAVLKDFLRNIPGSMLCVDLYDQWMEAMEGGEERIPAVQRLLHLLPSENLLLLRHVIAVLHCIQGSADDNQMNAFNLSVCIAPSMLWSPAPSTPEMEGEATKKVRRDRPMDTLDEPCFLLFFPDVSSFQMNDSSYDSLENELNDDPESPFQEQLPLRDKDKPDSCSRDSVITLSDGDPEPDPDSNLLLQLPPLARPSRFSPVVRQPRVRHANGSSQGPRRLRRSSEPALALASMPTSSMVLAHADNRHPSVRKASYDAAMEGEADVDEVFLEQGLNGLQLKEEGEDGCEKRGVKIQNSGRRKTKHAPPPPLRLDASCSSLSSPATSPTGSSLSSLDSAFSQYSTDYATNVPLPLNESLPLSPLFPGRPQQSSRSSPPQREALAHWPQATQPPRTCQSASHSHGLHPNTWLKKDRCLTLRQPDSGHTEEDLPVVNGKSFSTTNCFSVSAQEAMVTNQNCRHRSSSPPSYQQALLQLQRSHSPFYSATEKPLTVKDLRQLHDQTSPNKLKPNPGAEIAQRLDEGGCVQPPKGVFFGQSATTLVLQRQKSHSLTPAMDIHRGRKTLPRRASDPAKVNVNSNRGPSLTLDRLPASKARPQDGRASDNHAKPRLCLSPSATRAVRDYFSSQGQEDVDACLQRSHEVALAIVQGKKEWQNRRCSDPRLEDFEQLFFAEESYV
uniref:Rho GTPase-activating protein 20 n=1 Tax=Neolamprologus brichardi TaxID=32507 RepID=A0A3Q4GZV9_NEOBR